MARRLLNLLTVLSLLLCIAVAALWFVSHESKGWDMAVDGSERRFIGSYRGRLDYRIFSTDFAGGMPSGVRGHSCLGFGSYHVSYTGGGSIHSAEVPHWFVLVLTAVLPASSTVARIKRYRLCVAGFCPKCGYDLQATPNQCPECGAMAPSQPVG